MTRSNADGGDPTVSSSILIGPDDPRQYVRIATDLPGNLKMNAMSDPLVAIAASVIAICTAANSFTDGHVPINAMRRAGISDTIIKEMIAEDVWHDDKHTCERCTDRPKNGWFLIHDYLRHQRSGAMVRDLRNKRSAAGALGAERRWAKLRTEQATTRAKKKSTKAAKAASTDEASVDPKRAELLANAERLCEYLAGWIQRNHSKNERPAVGAAWLDDMRKLMDIDGFTVEELRDVIKWTQTHPFWSKNIRSPFKLRSQLKGENDLMGRMKADPQATGRELTGTAASGPSRVAQALSVADRLDSQGDGQLELSA